MTDHVSTESALLATASWILVGSTRNVPGVLLHDGRRLAFVGAEGLAMDVPLARVTDVRFPWWYFGGGCTLRAGDDRVRLSFVRPNGARDLTEDDLTSARRFALQQLGLVGDVLRVTGALRAIATGREATRRWREVLEGASA